MRRLIATLAVMAALVWAYQTGYSARRTPDNFAHAQETKASDPSFTEEEQLPDVFRPSRAPANAQEELIRLDENSVFQVDSSEEVKRALNAKPAENRFDRGTLNESFDGEIIRSRPSRLSSDDEQFTLPEPESAETVAPPAMNPGEEIAQALAAEPFGEDIAIPPPSAPRGIRPQAPTLNQVPGFADPKPNFTDPNKSTGKLIAGSPRRATVLPPRVMLIIGKDHQISVLPESRIPAESLKEMPPGSIIVVAQEFGLVPPTEPAAGNQVTCNGNVQLISPNVSATCSKLTFKGNSLVLEGTAEHRVEVRRQAAGDAAAFQLSADKISFTLSLDKIEIGGGVTVSPAAPTTAAPVTAESTTVVDPRTPPVNPPSISDEAASPVPIRKRPATLDEEPVPSPLPVDPSKVTPPTDPANPETPSAPNTGT